MPANQNPSGDGYEIRETRYSLRVLLKEVAAERTEGAFGHEKLRSQDVRKIFRAKSAKPRAAKN